MNLKDVYQDLIAPFDPREVKWKARATTKDKSKALAVAYIDARAVMDRLDSVVGPDNWHGVYNVVSMTRSGAQQAHTAIECILTVCGISKRDVGTAGQGDDVLKSAYSDALKRAAVKFGVGRYLYSIPSQWVAYDGRKLARAPTLPAWALPQGVQNRPPAATNGHDADALKYGDGSFVAMTNKTEVATFNAYVDEHKLPPYNAEASRKFYKQKKNGGDKPAVDELNEALFD